MPRPPRHATPPYPRGALRDGLRGRRSENLTALSTRARVAHFLLTLAALVLPGATSHAQESTLPLPADAMRAWRTVHSWLQEWRVPEEPSAIDPLGAIGACVTIRLDGVVLGRAADIDEDDMTLQRAARAAMAQARERAPMERGPDVEARLRVLARSLTLDVQLAGALVPLLGDSFDEAALSVGPGLDGVAARAGGRLRAVFPATMLAQNATPASALASAAAEALGEAVNIPGRDLKALREHRSLVPYRFPALHVAQTAPGKEPVFLTRAGRVVPPTDITEPALRDFADRLAEHLRSRVDERGVMLGAYEPWSDTFAQAAADAPERALAAFALARFARASTTDAAKSLAASRTAWTLLDALATEPAWAEDVASAAGFLVALRTLPARPTDLDPAHAPTSELRQQAERTIARAFVDGAWAGGLPGAARALTCYAAALTVTADGASSVSRAAALTMLRSLLAETPPGQMVTLMPWALWAELELAAPSGPVPSAVALAEMRTLVWQHQVSLSDTSAIAPDLLGGIVFTAGPVPLPTWQTARVLPALATMLSDERLTTNAERPGEFARLLLSLRFLRQLAADEFVAHLFPNPERAMWGVREAMWNQRQPADASALTLLAITETLRATRAPGQPRQKP